jgi:O-succinylbenzoic acid--CoA ligase
VNTPHLRAFLYDPSHQELVGLIGKIYESWSSGIGVSVIDSSAPKHLVDAAIIAIDPDEVVSNNETYTRPLAIFEEPQISVVSLTSGTTSVPKAVVHTPQSMKNSVEAITQVLKLDSNDSWILCLSPAYIAGMAVLARAFLLQQNVHAFDKFDTESIAKIIEDKKPNLISVVPAQLKMLLDDNVDLSGFKAILVGGAGTDPELLDRCEEMNYNVFRTYGMTETFGGICHDGITFPNTTAREVDGEIQLNTSSIFSSYRHDFNLTKSKFTEDGWFKTGDLGTAHNDYQISISGRSDDTIISGGIKINPAEIENILRKYINTPFVAGGKDHEKWGQALSIVFENDIPKDATLQTIRTLLSNDLDNKYLPLQTATVDTFQKTASGKIKRNETLQKSKVVEEHK